MSHGIRLSAVVMTAMLLRSAEFKAAQSIGLELGESKSVTVHANNPWNFSHVKLIAGHKYRFTVASPAWNNGVKETTAAGYNDPVAILYARYPEYRIMELVGEIFNPDNSVVAFTGAKFRIGTGRDYTATTTGYLVTFANDCSLLATAYVVPPCYLDNSRVVTLTIRRIP